jgi:hypothetical protein
LLTAKLFIHLRASEIAQVAASTPDELGETEITVSSKKPLSDDGKLLPPMAEPDFERLCLLPQRSFGPLH